MVSRGRPRREREREREREGERELKGAMQDVEPERAIKYSYDAVWVFQHCVLCARTCGASFLSLLELARLVRAGLLRGA